MTDHLAVYDDICRVLCDKAHRGQDRHAHRIVDAARKLGDKGLYREADALLTDTVLVLAVLDAVGCEQVSDDSDTDQSHTPDRHDHIEQYLVRIAHKELQQRCRRKNDHCS